MNVNDPGNNMTAFTVEVPAGWKFAGTILRPGGCHAPQIPADGLSYSAVAPDGMTATMQVPGSHWSWASDGAPMDGPKCGSVSIESATQFLLNIVVPNMHPSAKILGVVPPTPEMQQGQEAARRDAQARSTKAITQTVDMGRIRIEYDLNGQTVQEQLGTFITCMSTEFPAYPLLHRPAATKRTCASHGVYIKRAPQGKLDALVAMKLPNAKIDQRWDSMIAEKMRQQFSAYQKASDEQFQAMQEHFRQQTAGMLKRGQEFNDNLAASTRSSMQNAQNAADARSHAAHQTVLYSLDRQDFVDPTTGRKIETSNQYQHNWISSDKSEVVLNNDPTYDPNGAVDPVRESWTELIPVN